MLYKMLISNIKILLIGILLSFALNCTGENSNEVIIYTSLDQTHSEPILKGFEDASGIKVKAVYDTEVSKTAGLVNRLLAEKDNPRCDVFWSSEIVQTEMLKRKNISSPYFSPNAKTIPEKFKDKDGHWTGFATENVVAVFDQDVDQNRPTRAGLGSLWFLLASGGLTILNSQESKAGYIF